MEKQSPMEEDNNNMLFDENKSMSNLKVPNSQRI